MGHPARILVVDDDPTMRELVALHLRNAGYRVQLAEDAIAGARRVLEAAPDLLLVDVEMPHWNGLDFAATMRADTALPFIPIVVMTAHEQYALRTRRLGLDCLVKPFLKDGLLKVVERNLRVSALAGLAEPSAANQLSWGLAATA
ncbi:MAG: response regulator [Betaproteobacteria bacterium]